MYSMATLAINMAWHTRKWLEVDPKHAHHTQRKEVTISLS